MAKTNIDTTVTQAALADDVKTRESSRRTIRELAAAQGIFPASIQGLYEAAGKGIYSNKTVPAINIRGMTYQVARAIFRAALKQNVGAFIFEIARSEIDYTAQRPDEYVVCLLAAALKEKFQGPVFIQGDHYQVKRASYGKDPVAELNSLKGLIKESVEAGFLNIDIDASTIVDIDKPVLSEQQLKNYMVTGELTKYIRSIEPEGTTVSVGGEIGEIGKGNSTVGDLRAFMDGYTKQMGKSFKGISKISVQTGTTHGGVVLSDGSLAQVELDFNTLEAMSAAARKEYGLGGAVQHGASTLPDDAFDIFPRIGTLEVHLATGFQNIIYDSPSFPAELRKEVYKLLAEKYADERKQGETEDQFIYKTRKKGFGDFKKEMWQLPDKNMSKIMGELEERFALMFRKLNVVNTTDIVHRYVTHPSKAH
jgi:fructose/tagatose bisphosphate aldolase